MSLLRPAWLYGAVMLGLVVASLWLLLKPGNEVIEPPPPIAAVATNVPRAAPIDLAIEPGLFVPGINDAVPPTIDLGAPGTPVPSARPRLVGIAIKGRGRSIALAVDNAGSTHLIKPGDEVDGWVLESLNPGSAVFVRESQRETAILGQGAGQPSGPVATAPPSTSASPIKPEGSVP